MTPTPLRGDAEAVRVPSTLDAADIRPASLAQRRLWLLTQLDSSHAFHHLPGVWDMSGPLDIPALERALDVLLERHEALRTTFVALDGEPHRRIGPTRPFALGVIDLRHLADRDAEAERLTRAEAQRPFDLETGPLVRGTLLRLGEQTHRLLLTLHRMVADDGTARLLLRELRALHAAFTHGRVASVPPAPAYSTFVRWEQEQAQGEGRDAQVAYWRQRLAGSMPVLDLPADRPRASVQGLSRGTHDFTLSAELTAALDASATESGLSLSALLLASFATLLHRYTGKEDFILGTPVSHRSRPEFEHLVGPLTNTLALRMESEGNPRFVDFARRVQDSLQGAVAHQTLPFETLVAVLQPERNLSHAPLFQVMFAMEESAEPVEGAPRPRGTVACDLILFMARSDSGLRGTFEFDTDLFDSERIHRMAGHLRVLLHAAVAQPHLPLRSLPLLTSEERHQLLIDFAPPPSDFPRDSCVHHLFSLQASLSPDSPAVSYADSSLSYRQLDERSNQLAHHLRSLGVGPEVLVALCLHRSTDLLICLLAILKAGGAYLPLDPSYPRQRLAFMLEDARVSGLLAHEDLLPSLPPFPGSTLLFHPSLFSSLPSSPPPPSSSPDNLAYVIYTSGSTGNPKGSSISHRGLCALFFNVLSFPFSPSDRVAQASNISFDPSSFEIWGALLHGAHLVGISANPAREPLAFASQVHDARISVMFVTTAVLTLLSREAPSAFSSLHTLVFGGEAADPLALREVFRHGPPRRLLNGYGPTECTVFSTAHLIPSPPPLGLPVPIGPPLPHGPVFILDSHFNPCPIGVPGELFISGERLGRGYFNRPELTALTWRPHPFSSLPGQRLYKTGDLARFLPNGLVEYLGRIDHQVKIRGFRVELGEIEERLRLHPLVKECAVIARDFAGDRKLIAYLVPRLSSPSHSDLRSFLLERLPEHMVPSSFSLLSSLPLTPNGKLDKRALPNPDSSSLSSPLAPRSPLEVALCRLWASLLELPSVSPLDNFFHLGGHSLLATQLVSRIRETFQVQLPLRRIFDAPTVEAQAQAIEAARLAGSTEQGITLARIPRGGDLPMSFAQERLWFLEQLQAGNLAYKIPISYRITSALDVRVLERSLQELVKRHEVLGATYHSVDSRPVQRIGDARPFALEVQDLRTLSETERAELVERRSVEESARPFDLTQGPLMHGLLLRLGEQEHLLLLTMHHIVSDGWSLGVLLRELRTLYDAFAVGHPSPLPALPVQYVDFASSQQGLLRSAAVERLLTYWRKQLAGAPEVLDLPADRPRPPIHRFKGATYSFHLPPELSQAVDELCRREGVTLFMTLLAGFTALLQRYSGREDIVVGAPVAHRSRPELEGLVGLFVNTLVLRTDLSGDPSFVGLLARVREVTLGAFAHQELPFEKLVEVLRPERSLSYAPLFQVMFVLQNAPTLAPDPSSRLQLEATAEPWEMSTGTSKCDLILFMARSDSGLRGTFEFDTDLFDSERIHRMAGHLRVLLHAAVAQPHLPLRSLPLLTSEERHQLLVDFAPPPSDFPRDSCVHHLFSLQAFLSPDSPAVSYADSSLSYRQLDERSNQLAHHLRSLGVGPEVLVALCLHRSTDLLICLLAILKAGGAYLPLDPSYPRQRLAFMLEDARVSGLLAHEDLLPSLPPFPGSTLLFHPSLFSSLPSSPPPPSSSPDNLAYVIYTSGSTGNPKGSSISHRGLCALFFNVLSFPFSPSDRVAQASNISFDPSSFEIWGALLHGAHLVGISANPAREPLAFASQVHDARISVMFVTTAVLTLLSREAPSAFSSLHTLVFGGEAADPLALREVFRHGPPRRLLNGYGPTECTVFSTAHLIPSPPPLGLPVPIGPPLPHGPVFILDSHFNPCPIGVPGELFISGERLGRGYFNRPELTALTWRPHPFSSLPGQRLYKTGDLARFLPNGLVEYLGRIDHQVKIRGFRVELGEIEERLRLHPLVKECAVIARDFAGDRKLIAYLVPRLSSPSHSDLRSFLLERLPEHMVPSSFSLLSSLPLTPNGKLDKRALPNPDSSSLSSPLAPRSPLEVALCRLWASLLELPSVSPLDNFFHLGGHSLLATQLVSRIRAEFGVELSLRTLFLGPTVAEMAKHLSDAKPPESTRPLPPLVRTARGGPIALSFSQERLWRFQQRQPESAAYNMPDVLHLRGRVDPRALRGAFQALVLRHESLRAMFGERDGRPVQWIHPEARFTWQELDLSGHRDREAESRRFMQEAAQRPFDLTRDPLVRASLLRMGDTEHLLVLNVHHIASDGWSVGVLFRELGALYGALAEGREPSLPALDIQYPDYAVWQRGWLTDAELAHRLDYWKQALAGAPFVLDLPTDRPRPAERTFAGTYREVYLGRERSDALNALCQREQVTPFMALLALFGAVLARTAGQPEVVIGSPIANRLHPELESLIGMFVNGLALRVSLAGTPTFRELLKRVREETLGGYAHQEVPFEKVVEALGVVPPANRSPVFQAMFVLQNAPGAPLELPGLTLTPIVASRESSAYEVTLSLQEAPEGFGGVLEFNTDLFDPSTGERLRTDLLRLLDAVVENPDLPMGFAHAN
ncbi:non-ribosomal peptide synthetase [Corallococcus sp. H22C18031201]|nr:non-ribosomal peptide synthetase [Corallococcus sp. H22C18031201]